MFNFAIKSGIMFTKACEYAIKAVIVIAIESQKGKRVSLNEIAGKIDSPAAFTAKILQQLTRSKVIDSVTGPQGGFEIEKRKIAKTKLSDIVSIIDGDAIYAGCGLGFKQCNEKKPCPVHFKFKTIRDELRDMLETTTLLDLSNDIGSGITFLKRS